MRDRRFDYRQALGETVHLEWVDAAGPLNASGELRDISASGAQVRLGRPIRMKTLVEFKTELRTLRGTVRYCTPSESGYLVGIRFEPGLIQ